MNNIPKLIILDRDGLINHHSSDKTSPFYYILDRHYLIEKPNITLALSLLTILREEYRFKIVLSTKQRCISQELITADKVCTINHLAAGHGFFDAMYVEDTKENKIDLFTKIITDFNLKSQDILLIDDSAAECKAAESLGIRTLYTNDLYKAVCDEFKIL